MYKLLRGDAPDFQKANPTKQGLKEVVGVKAPRTTTFQKIL